MSLTPRIKLGEDFIQGLQCAICASPELTIVHIEKYPDFVSCNNCGSAFVVENEGSWVMYGKIPPEYPETSQFALKQWTWLDAVKQRAMDEREQSSSPTFVTDIPHVAEETPPKTAVSPTPIDEVASVESAASSLPFIEEAPTPSLEELYPEERLADSQDESRDMAEIPPFPDDVIILGDGSSDIYALKDATPAFMEPGPGAEAVIVPEPFEPIEVPEIIEIEEPILLDGEDLQPSEPSPIEDITELVMDRNPEIFISPPVETVKGPYDIEKPEVPAAEAQPVIVTASPAGDAEKPLRSGLGQKDRSLSVPVGEPEPDTRFQATIQGSQPKYPKNYCAHCLRTPVKLKTIMRGSLPDQKQPGRRKLVPLELPFCKDCQKRMQAQSDDERTARLIAFLASGIVALILIIILFLLPLDLFENIAVGILVLLAAGILGFSLPFFVLLERSKRFPPPRDAAFVLSTLLVHDAGSDLTDFEWRNHGYAELFRQVNIENVRGDLERVEDRTTFTEIQPPETHTEPKKEPGQLPVEEQPEEENSNP